MQPIKIGERKMQNILLDTLPIWTTAQAQKTSNRGISASNQQLLGIQKLRELILELAIRGKLVHQDPNDEPAMLLLKKIEAEKKRLIKVGKIKKQVALSEVEEGEKLFQMPKGWEWVKIGNIGYTQTGGTPSKNNNSFFGEDIPFIKPGDIYPNEVDYFNEGLSFKGADSLGRSANEGSILMVCIGTIGKCNLIDRTCAFNQQINSISPYHSISGYLLLSLRSKYFQDTAWEKSSSTTIAILNKGKWENIGIPLPPLSEQHRIVAKVDELMSLCDELENEQTNSNRAHEMLVEVLLGTLTNAKNSYDFKEAWQRIAACFDTLFTTEHSIDKLKQTILQLAVMGKLVPQDPNDEPASELLKKIAKEKARLVKEGNIKKQAEISEITEEEKPFELPKGWEWVRFSQIGENSKNAFKAGPFGSALKKDMYVETGYKIYGQEQVISGDENLGDYFINQEKYNSLESCAIKSGDILISLVGTIGKVLIISDNCQPGIINPRLVKLSLYKDVFRPYIQLMLSSILIQDELKDKSHGGTMNILNLGLIKELIFPLPPIVEQSRIVSKIDELFALCDSLKGRIREAQVIKNVLAEEIVRRVVR